MGEMVITTNATFSNCIFDHQYHPINNNTNGTISTNEAEADFNTTVLIVYQYKPSSVSLLSVNFINCTFRNYLHNTAVTILRTYGSHLNNDNYDSYNGDYDDDNFFNDDDNNSSRDEEAEEDGLAGSFDVYFIGCDFDSNLESIHVNNITVVGFSMTFVVSQSTFRNNTRNALDLDKVSLSKEGSGSSQLVIQIVNSSFVDSGAALSISDGVASDVVISDCLFENNSADEAGGAIYIYDMSSSIYILSSTFRNNSVQRYGGGGAIYGEFFANLVIRDCLFDSNSAPCLGDVQEPFLSEYCVGGAILTIRASNISLIDSMFYNNSALLAGGAVIISDPSHIPSSSSNNIDDDDKKIQESTITTVVSGCRFENNNARRGGALYFADVIQDQNKDNSYPLLQISSTLFFNNSAFESGGSLYSSALSATVTNCTFQARSIITTMMT